MTDLPFVFIEKLYHMGDMCEEGSTIIERTWEKHIDYELGLLSTSLDPSQWDAPGLKCYEFSKKAPGIKLLDVDSMFVNFRSQIITVAVAEGFLQNVAKGVVGTPALYSKLLCVQGGIVPAIGGQTEEDGIIQAALACLLDRDTTVDGLWWSNTFNGAMRTERAGLLLNRGPSYFSGTVPVPPSGLSSPANKSITTTIL